MENSTLTDDAALLREALAFIGDLDGDDNSLSPPSVDDGDGFLWSLLAEPTEFDAVDTPRSHVAIATAIVAAASIENEAAPPPRLACLTADNEVASRPPLAWPTAKGNTKPSGTKRRQEIAYLREVVGELESKLTQVKQQTLEQKLEHLGDATSSHTPSSLALHAAWAEVATHQSEQRERAEKENIKLKRLLEDQIQVGKSLERLLLRKRPKLEDAEPVEKRARVGSISPSSPWDSDQIFQELMASIDRQYCETARVLTKVLSLHDGQLTHHRKVELVHDEVLGMVLQSSETRILPFAYELATQEFWRAIPVTSFESNVSPNDFDMSDDLIKTQFSASASSGRVHGDISVHSVDRRFREPHRTVVVTSAFVDPTKISDLNMDGVYICHRGWVVLEPFFTESGRAATKMTSHLIMVPQVVDRLDDQTRKVGTLTNFAMAALSIELENRQQALENRLFDRSAK